jgi:hypothetical protein
MNKARPLFSAIILTIGGVAAVTAQAQTSQGDPAPGTPVSMMGMEMGAGMGMMSGPMHQRVLTPFLLPELQSELSLSARQVSQLRQLTQDMLTKGKDLSSQIAAKEKVLNALLTPGTSKRDELKRLFEQIASLRVEQLYTEYKTTTKSKLKDGS